MDGRSADVMSSYSDRSDSELRVDLHVYIVPTELWREHLHSAVNQIIGDTVSAGFIRVLPETTIYDVRPELESQINDELIPRRYVFLRCVGRCFTRLRPGQEHSLKVKHFIPPQSYAPELFILDTTALRSTENSSISSSNNSRMSRHKVLPNIVRDNSKGTQTGENEFRSSPRAKLRKTLRAVRVVQDSRSRPTAKECVSRQSQTNPNKGTQTLFSDSDDSLENLPLFIEYHSVSPSPRGTQRQREDEEDEERRRQEHLMRKQKEEDELRKAEELERRRKEEQQRADAEAKERTRRQLEEDRQRQEALKKQLEEQMRQEEQRRLQEAERMKRQLEEMKKEEQRRMEEEEALKRRQEQMRLDEQRRIEEQMKEEFRKKMEELEKKEREMEEEMRRIEQKKLEEALEKKERQMEEEMRRLEQKKLEEARRLAAEAADEIRRLEMEKLKEKEMQRVEDERIKREEERRKNEEEKLKAQKSAIQEIEKAALVNQIEELKASRMEGERKREEMMKKAKQLQNKARSNRQTTGRDVWKKKYFEEKRKTIPLEDQTQKLRRELEMLQKQIISQMEKANNVNGQMTPGKPGGPSEQNNLKMQAVRLQQETEAIQRRIGDVNMKLTAEMKLRNQVEQELKGLRSQLTHRRSKIKALQIVNTADMSPTQPQNPVESSS